MALRVQKYGGSSVATPKQIREIAKQIARARSEGTEIVVVVSARGDTTDDLIDLAREVHPEPARAGREYDALLATGEKESAALLALALLAHGVAAISMTGAQAGIQTDSVHRKARICGFDPAPIRRQLAQGQIVIVAGFQGVDREGQITTLGRGGSDITAAALAAGLGAERCEFFKDVPGFHTADPRHVPTATVLQALCYDEAMELGSVGAQIIHPRAVELARRYRIPLLIRQTLSEAPGTWIQEVAPMENIHGIRGVVADTRVVKISVIGVPDRP
ncbi:MAG: aspartate kinase, partial [Candidatus Bipolaricaulota bacterium]|nr:aspartate kinase [Candidatus Bipolaricaulota bacterium]